MPWHGLAVRQFIVEKKSKILSIGGQNGPNEVDMEALTAKPFITDQNNASSLVILLFFAHIH